MDPDALSPMLRLERQLALTTEAERAALPAAERRALAELAEEDRLIAERVRLNRGLQLGRTTIEAPRAPDDLEHARRARNASALTRVGERVEAAVENYRRHLERGDIELLSAPRPSVGMGDARRIRQQSVAHQTNGPPPPGPLSIPIQQTTRPSAALRKQLPAASSTPPKAGTKVATYVSQSTAYDFALLAERFPGEPAPQLVRRALAHLAAEALTELVERDARESEEVAYGRVVWN
jgi:hypothetical protein